MDNIKDIQRLREEYESAQDEAETRRAEYHRAIKKLHLSGVPLREIAEGLGLSHQRVHQIVTGESAPRRRGRRGVKGALAVVALLATVSLIATAGFLLHARPAP